MKHSPKSVLIVSKTLKTSSNNQKINQMSEIDTIKQVIANDAAKIKAEAVKLEGEAAAEITKLLSDFKSGKVVTSYWVFPVVAIGGWILIEIGLKVLAHIL